MLEKLKHHINIGLFSTKLTLQGQLEYPTFLVGWFFANFLQFFIGIFSVKFVLDSFNLLNGWTFNEICFLYGLGILSHGISIVLYIQTWYIKELVIHGGFDRMKLRPLGVLFQFCFENFNLIGLTDLWPGICIFVYGCIAVKFQWNLENTIKIILVVIGATLIRGGIYTLNGSIAFWTKGSNNLLGIINTLYHKSIMYPISMYDTLIQTILTFLFPIAFISFYPACEFLNKDSGIKLPGSLALYTPIIGIIITLLSVLVFNKGIKRYDSSGT